jgi:CRP/FNR family transcriptional regulator
MNRIQELSSHEDPLTYLPRKPAQEFARGWAIYDGQQPNEHLYVVISGRVKISNCADDGCQTVGRIVSQEGLFGESCLVGGNHISESAMALDNSTVMSWSRTEIEQQIERQPQLGLALSQYLVKHCISLQDRIESMAVHRTPERISLALIQLAADLGSATEDGASRVPSLTHHTIADYVGTSREIVTFQMNRLRRLGFIRYSRKYIDVYAEAMKASLREQGISLPQGLGEMKRAAG